MGISYVLVDSSHARYCHQDGCHANCRELAYSAVAVVIDLIQIRYMEDISCLEYVVFSRK